MNIPQIIEQAKSINKLTSDLALGEMIGVSDVAIIKWKQEKAYPTTANAYKLAKLSNTPPEKLILHIMMMKAKDDDLRESIQQLQKQQN